MTNYKDSLTLIKETTIEQVKQTYRPTLSSKQSMEAYQKAMGTTGKATFGVHDDEETMMINYVD